MALLSVIRSWYNPRTYLAMKLQLRRLLMPAPAQIREETLRIPTYHIAEDPNPPLFSGTDPWVYPYPKQEDILRPPDAEQAYHAVVMENDYLRVTVLPEIGGRLYSAYDKMAGREIFYRPAVVKPALIGLRGAWICGGIEFNFIKGHHVLTFSPVDHLTRQNPDGSVSVTVGHLERASRARWNVTLTLRPDRAYVQVDLRLYNRGRYRLDFYQWSNSAVRAQEDVVLPYPTQYVISSGRKLYRYPIQGRADISHWRTTPIAHDFFAIGGDGDFMGAYYEHDDVGMVHYASHYEAPGKKYFTWGTDDAGRIWDQLLTDSDTPYLEPQSGCVVDQSTFLFLQPHQVVQWREYWWGVRGIKGFVQVNEHAALNLAPAGESKTVVAANSTSVYEGARLRLLVNGETRYETGLDLSPEQPFCREIDLPPAAWRSAEAVLSLEDAAGREIIRYTQPAPNLFEKVTLPAPFDPQVDARSTAEELAVAANEAEKLRDYERAEALYRQALGLDPGYARALAALGALYSRQGLYRRAYDELTAAVRRDPDYALAHYHLGIVCRELADLKSARDHFWATRLDPAVSAQSFYYLGEMALADDNPQAAAGFFRRSLESNMLHTKAHDMLALSLRRLGRAEAPKTVLQRVLADIDPADLLAMAERWFLQTNDETLCPLLERIAGDPQVLLELAHDYAGVGAWRDVVALLRAWPGVAKESPAHAMLYYTLGYAYDKLGDSAAAARHYGLAAQMDPAYVFPHRLEELRILERALEVRPADARARGYLGTLLYALRRYDEGMDAWRQSLAREPSPVNHRNLGKALWKRCGNLAQARDEYERAIALAPDDHRLFVDLYDLLTELAVAPAEKLALLERAPRHGRIDARLAAVLVELEAWDRAIEVLQKMQFDPYEGERGTRPAYYAAYLGRAEERHRRGDLAGALSDLEQAMQYPRNVGVGKSYFAQDVRAYYWAGVVAEEMGDADKARYYWEEGAAIRPWPQEDPASPRDGYQEPQARYYKSLCLQRLGRGAQAAELF